MEPNKLCTEFSEAKQNEYEKEIRERFGYRGYEGVIDWNSYAPAEKEKIKNESEEIYRDLIAKMALGPQSREVQGAIARWHQHLRYFYEPSNERMKGLAQMYDEHPEFRSTFNKMHPDLPHCLREAIEYYVEQRT